MRASALVRSAGFTLLLGLVPAAAHASPRPGVEFGLNESETTIRADFAPPDPGYHAAWSAGLTLDVPLAPRLSVATGLRYLEYGERVTASIVSYTGGARFERHLVWRRLAVPAQLRVRPLAARGVYLAGGPEASYLLTAWHQDWVALTSGPVRATSGAALARPAGEIYEETGTFFADPNGVYSRWDLALAGGAGCEFPLLGHSGRIEGRYTHGLLDISKRDGLERHTRAFELLLGMSW
jgi:hypothetical protein